MRSIPEESRVISPERSKVLGWLPGHTLLKKNGLQKPGAPALLWRLHRARAKVVDAFLGLVDAEDKLGRRREDQKMWEGMDAPSMHRNSALVRDSIYRLDVISRVYWRTSRTDSLRG